MPAAAPHRTRRATATGRSSAAAAASTSTSSPMSLCCAVTSAAIRPLAAVLAALLSTADRPGIQTPALRRARATLAARALADGPDKAPCPLRGDAREIAPRHAARVEFGMARMLADAAAQDQEVFLCTAIDQPHAARPEEVHRRLASIANPNTTRRMPGVIPLRYGHAYTARELICRRRHIVPGTEAVLVGIAGLQRVATTSVAAPSGAAVRVSTINMPTMLLLQVPGAEWADPEGWSPGVFPLFPRFIETIDVPAHVCDCRIARRQLLLLPADALTI